MCDATLEVVEITGLNLYKTVLATVGAIKFFGDDYLFRLLLPKPLDVTEFRQVTAERKISSFAFYDEGMPGMETKLYGVFSSEQHTFFILRIEEDTTLYLLKVAGRFVSESALKWMADINHAAIRNWSNFQLGEITELLKAAQLYDNFLASLLSAHQKGNFARLVTSGGCSLRQLLDVL